MKARRSHLRTIAVLFVLTAILLLPHLSAAQTPSPLLPGETPEASRPYATYWLSFLVLAGAAGLILILGFAYWRLSSRFYGREEPPPLRQRPRFAGMSAAQPVAAAPQGAMSAQPGAAAAARADRPAAQPAASAPAASSPEGPAAPTEAPAATGEAATATGEAPAAAAETTAGPDKEAAAPAPASAGGHVEPDQATFDRVLQEQLDKGVDRRVAEGRARAAAVRAAREKAGAG